MRDENGKTNDGRYGIKLTVAIASMLFVYLSPYLNITHISINMDLLESVIYSLLLIGFWIVATIALKHKTPQYKHIQKSVHHKQPLTG